MIIELNEDDNVIEIETEYCEKDMLKAVRGMSWNPKKRRWLMPANVFNAKELLERFCNASRCIFSQAVKALALTPPEAEVIRRAKIEELIPITKARTDAWDHQVRAFNFIDKLPSSLLEYGMGTGKTKVVCDWISERIDDLSHRNILIVCPKSVLPVWPKQFGVHMTDYVQERLRVVVVGARASRDTSGILDITEAVTGTTERKNDVVQRALDRTRYEGKKICVVIVNYETAWRNPLNLLLLKTKWDLMVLDESHKIKSPGGKASKFFGRLRSTAKKRVCLTGTPIPNSPLDIYGQFRFLDDTVFGTSFHRFKQKYAILGGFQNKQVVGFTNENDMNARYSSLTLRAGRDVIKLEGSDHVERFCTLGKDTKKAYNDLRNHMVAEIDNGVITVSNALTKFLRLQQITSGFLPVEEENKRIGTEKRDLLEDVMEDIGHKPIVVFCKFHHDLDTVREVTEKLGWEYCEQSGRCSQWTEFNNGKFDVIGVQIQSGNAGIDLTRASYGIYYSVGFSLGDFEQSWCRLDRPGQKNRVLFVHLIAQGTIDEYIYKSLRKKKKVIETLFEEREW